jgi:carbonic anhydrase
MSVVMLITWMTTTLQVGNQRFVAGMSCHPHEGADWRHHEAVDGQQPFCTILGCSDSRAPVQVKQ